MGGVSAARNKGIETAKGKYLCFVDADDWIEANTLELLANKIQAENPDILVFGYTELSVGSECTIIYQDITDTVFIKEQFISDEWRNYAWNKCFKKELFKNRQFPIAQTYEDLYLIPQLIAAANKIVLLPEALYKYNQNNPNSITKNLNSSNEYDFFLALLKNYYLAKENNLNCATICRYKTLERAQMAILANFTDCKLPPQKLSLLVEYFENEMPCEIIDVNYKYKIYHKAAIIFFRKRKIVKAIIYFIKYTLAKIQYKCRC